MLLRKVISKLGGVQDLAVHVKEDPPHPRHLLTKASHAVNHKPPQVLCELYILPGVVHGQQLLLFPRKRALAREALLEEIKQTQKFRKSSRDGGETSWDDRKVCFRELFVLIPANKEGNMSGSLDRKKILKFECSISIYNTV